MKFDLDRFKKTQQASYGGYTAALDEVTKGKKLSHWIWYIFPQLKGLGHSYNSDYYGIASLEEAREYLEDEVLGKRLREISQALKKHDNLSVYDIFGGDAKKVKSSITLFDMVSPNDIFACILDVFFQGKRDKMTIKKIARAT